MELVPEPAQIIFLDLGLLGLGIAVRQRSYCFAAVIGLLVDWVIGEETDSLQPTAQIEIASPSACNDKEGVIARSDSDAAIPLLRSSNWLTGCLSI
jgi:hypothetical protein